MEKYFLKFQNEQYSSRPPKLQNTTGMIKVWFGFGLFCQRLRLGLFLFFFFFLAVVFDFSTCHCLQQNKHTSGSRILFTGPTNFIFQQLFH